MVYKIKIFIYTCRYNQGLPQLMFVSLIHAHGEVAQLVR